MQQLPFPYIHAEASGSSAGPKIILLHELGGSLRSWDAVAQAFGPDLRVLRYDQRGAGQSEKPRRPYPFDAHVEDLERVLGESGWQDCVVLAGTGIGAAIAAGFAARWPQRTRGLVLFNPALSVEASRRGALEERAKAVATGGMRAVFEETLRRSYPLPWQRQAAFGLYVRRFLGNDPHAYGLANIAFATVDLPLERIAAPCLAVVGEADILRPAGIVGPDIARIPGARLETAPGAHLMPVQEPLVVARIIRRFCDGLPE